MVLRKLPVLIPRNLQISGMAPFLLFRHAVSISLDEQSFNQDRAQRGLLRRMMQGESATTSPIMVPPTRIVERQSTDVLAAADPMVARTLVRTALTSSMNSRVTVVADRGRDDLFYMDGNHPPLSGWGWREIK